MCIRDSLYIDGGDLGRAEYAYKRALEVDSHHVNAMHNLAIVYKRQKKMSLYVKTYKKSQRMRIRYPRQANLSPEERSRLRRFGGKYLIWFLVGGALLVLIIYLALR